MLSEMADYFPSTFFFCVIHVMSSFVLINFREPQAGSLVLVILISIFHLTAEFHFFFSRSDVLKVTAAVAAIYPPTGWPRPRFLDQSPYTPHFVMFCLTLPFVCTAPDFSLSLCIQCFPRVFLVSSCCGEAVAQFLIKT